MKRLTAGLTILVFLTFLNPPLFSAGEKIDPGVVTDQFGIDALHLDPTSPGEITDIKPLLDDIEKNRLPYKDLPPVTEDWADDADDDNIPKGGPTIQGLLPKGPDDEYNKGKSPEDPAPSTPSEQNHSFDPHQTQPPPLRSVVEDLFKFISEKEEGFRKIDLVDGEFSFSDLESAVMRQLELQLAQYIDAALSAIEENEINALDVIVLDAAEFTAQIRAIHKLLNPPARLDPLLKWLLYLNRVTPEMIELYQAALEKRDRIFLLAARSSGKLKIRYNGKILDEVVYVWPDQDVRYELVIAAPTAPASSAQQPLS